MPMPPPRPSTEGHREPGTSREMQQLRRALKANGPQPPEKLAELVGAAYWDPHHFERALTALVNDGLVHTTTDGKLTAT